MLDKIAGRDDVIAAYRTYLKRDPESEDAIQTWLKFSVNKSTLREMFIHSEEFKNITWQDAVQKMRELAI
ncbi:hypothetical protein V1281_000283 [Nitrobacteraceae bacterium AZCC 2161]